MLETGFHSHTGVVSHAASVSAPRASQRVVHVRVPSFHWHTPELARHAVSVVARAHADTQPPAFGFQMHCASLLQNVLSEYAVEQRGWHVVPLIHSHGVAALHASAARPAHACWHVRVDGS
ncbi:MAG: hypothetical protein ACK53C_06810, partial [Pseudomonadota bacterium]